MTIWMFRPTDDRLFNQVRDHVAHIMLPITDFPKIDHEWQVRQEVQRMHSDMPPESTHLMAQPIWQFIHQIEPEDTILVLDSDHKAVHCAEVTGITHYVSDNILQDGGYQLPVQWYPDSLPMAKFMKYPAVIHHTDPWLVRIDDNALKQLLLALLPVKRKFFARMRWLIVVLFIMNVSIMLYRQFSS